VYKNLDVDAMGRAAKDFLGTHCFTSFCSTHTQVQDHVRTIYSLDILKEDHLLTIRIRGNGFLYNMVRIIAGTLIKIGMHEMSDSCISSILEAENREAAGPTAPALGLTLVGIEYPNLKKKASE
jgi:tRNA pseudouridine38-40 synthase